MAEASTMQVVAAPIVMMNANRSVALPWSIYGDQRDSLSLLDSGWIQVYVEDGRKH
jgi:pyruvate ferredoxin oxidoreductase alpha subunit